MHAFAGSTTHGVDPTTLSNKAMCGYQGWFNAEADGAGFGALDEAAWTVMNAREV